MSLEAMAIKTVENVAKQTTQLAEATIKKVWSVLDAASEKKAPTEYLSQQAISAIQGNEER